MKVTTILRKLGILFVLLISYSIVAFGATLQIVPSTATFTNQYLLQNNLNVEIKFFNPQNYHPVESDLYLYLYDCKGNVISSVVEPVSVQCGYNVYTYTFNGYQLLNYLQGTSCNDVILEAQLVGYSNSGSTLFDLSNSVTYYITTVPQTLSVQLVNYQNYSLSYIEENGLPLDILITLSEFQNIQLNGIIYITLTNENGKIVYQNSQQITILPGTNEYKTTIYSVQLTQGEYNLQINVVAYGNGINLQASNSYTILISNSVNGVLYVESVAPNFNLLEYLSTETQYPITVTLYNPTTNYETTSIYLYVYDQYGNIVYQQSTSATVPALSEQQVQIPFNTYTLTSGQYTIEIEAYLGNQVIYDKKWNVIVGRLNIYPIKVLNVVQYPFVAYPGNYIEFTLELENTLPQAITVNIYVESQPLNLYQTLSTLTLQPNEIETLNVVVKVPENTQYGTYPVNFVFNYNGALETYTYNLFVNGTMPTVLPISASLVGYEQLTYGKNTTVDLIIKSNSEEICNLLIQAYATNGIVYPEQTSVQIGGMYTEVIPLNLTPTGNPVSLNVVIIDQNTGQVLYTLQQNYTTTGVTATYTIPTEYIIYGLLALIIIIIIVAILSTLGKGEKEKPEE